MFPPLSLYLFASRSLTQQPLWQPLFEDYLNAQWLKNHLVKRQFPGHTSKDHGTVGLGYSPGNVIFNS